MGEFLRGRRRKTGLVTLVMACVFMGGWMRSGSVSEFFIVKFVPDYAYVFGSHHGVLTWAGRGSDGTEKFYSILPSSIQLMSGLRFLRCWRFFGIESAEAIVEQNGITIAYWNIPYWSVVIPLTAISGFLLLSKPRKSTQTKLTEPIQDEGGGATS